MLLVFFWQFIIKILFESGEENGKEFQKLQGDDRYGGVADDHNDDHYYYRGNTDILADNSKFLRENIL